MPLSRQIARGALSFEINDRHGRSCPGRSGGLFASYSEVSRSPQGETCPCKIDPRNLPSAGRLSMPHEEGKICNALSYLQLQP